MKYSVNAAAIKHARIINGYSQAELAKMVGISALSISNIEREQTVCPRPKVLKKLCDTLSLKVSDVCRTGGDAE